ncbi:MAG TPA: tannase/feruloyl esterase family alpha/beta hydrolase [Bryobacteraceae bacterium]|nr:tannase/feruloyl esterase family alpha/beta hydrolase [Bryobacteraceae bacterium]
MKLLLFAGTLLCAAAADCEGLAKLKLPATTITEARLTPTEKDVPAHCRVTGVIAPTSDSVIKFAVWMPAEGWNGKFLGVGNGGYAGSISVSGLAEAVRNGFASASTDTGHEAGQGVDAKWALNHPEKIIDYGHRAIHLMTVQGKAITTAFYGSAPKRSYFSSCSNGGRQALMEAQRYPEDYDGIVAGAPANDWVHLMANAAFLSSLTMRDAEFYIPSTKLPAIQAATVAACDKKDGVEDGVVENPAACGFDPAVLLCKGDETDQCLTKAQAASLRVIYGGLKDAKGKQVYPGYALSGEAEKGSWGSWITGPGREQSAMYQFSTNFFKYMVYSNPNWDYRSFDVARDLPAARKLAVHLSAVNPDLRAFQARGGKLILYHGWCDAAIPGQAVIDYYNSVVQKMGAANAQSFVRLFMAPGVQHCWSGAGPDSFGQNGAPKGDPESNIAAAVVAWVENGRTPERITASKPGRTRPLCAYPMTAKYKGSGSTDDAANFDCAR